MIRLKEKELYGAVGTWLEGQVSHYGWVKKKPTGKRPRIPDLLAIDWVHLGNPKLYTVEVKKGGQLQNGLYQALKYKYGSHRSFLAAQDKKIKSAEARREAEHLGIGLLFITKKASRAYLVQSAIESPPADADLYHALLNKAFDLVNCAVCNCYAHKNMASTIKRYPRDMFPKRKGKKPSKPIPRPKRYICKKCRSEFNWEPTEKRGRPRKARP